MNFMLNDLVADEEDDGRVRVPADVEEAVRTLLRWAGDDPLREGLLDTPKRVGRAWREERSSSNTSSASSSWRTR